RVEAALLPDEPGKKVDWQIIFRRCPREGLTDAVGRGWNARRRRSRRLAGFDPTTLVGFTCARLRDAAIRRRARSLRRLQVRPSGHRLTGDDRRCSTW